MSSHHFVREGQEPALMIMDALSYERVAPLLEWAPAILVHERSLHTVLSWGIKIDGVICNSASLEKIKGLVADQMPLEIVTFKDDEKETETAFKFLESENEESVCVVVSDAQKIMNESSSSKLKITILTDDFRWSFIKSGVFEKWMLKGQKISFQTEVPFDELNGVVALGNQLVTVKEGLIKLASNRPFWIGEEY